MCKFFIDVGVTNILDTKITWSVSMPVSGGLSVSLHYHNGLNALMC
jgi:hypothetical protein